MDTWTALARRLAPRFAICSISVLTAGLALVTLTLGPESTQLGEVWSGQSKALLIAFGAAGFAIGIARGFPLRLVFLAVQLGIAWVLSVPYSNPFLVSIYLVAALIFESAVVLQELCVLAVSALSLILVLASPRHIVAFGVEVPARTPELAVLFAVIVVTLTAFTIVVRYMYRRAAGAQDIRRQLEEALSRLAETNIKLQDYATIAERQAMDEERKRIAQEVHDVLGHTLATVNMTLQASIGMIRADGDPRLLSILGAARLHVKEGMLELRRALSSLAAHSEEPFYDKPRILKLTRNVTQATGLRVDLEFGNTGSLGTQEQAAAIYRLLQEGITNAIRHGNASYVDIHFQDLSSGLMVYIKDNGSGVGYNEPGFGIGTMHKRLSEMGGTLTIEPNIPRGTTLRAWIPSRREA